MKKIALILGAVIVSTGLFAQKARYIALWRKKKVGNFGKLYKNVYICAEYIVRAYA